MWLMQMTVTPQLGSNIQNQFDTTTEQSIGLMTPTIGNMITLHFLLFGGKSGGLQDNLHFFWRWQEQMQQMPGGKQGNKKQNLS